VGVGTVLRVTGEAAWVRRLFWTASMSYRWVRLSADKAMAFLFLCSAVLLPFFAEFWHFGWVTSFYL
jgi:hypothetical protein